MIGSAEVVLFFLCSLLATGAHHKHHNNQQDSSPRSLLVGARPLDAAADQQQQQQQLQLHQNGTGACPSPAAPIGKLANESSHGYVQQQLSSFVRPIFYTLRLKVDPTKRKFTGQLMVTLEVLAPPAADESPADSTGAAASTENGYRYLTLHAGPHLQVSKAFYVYQSRGSVQIPATKLGKSARDELLTLDFHPNLITAGQGLLLLVYSGAVNDTDSHGLFLHHSLKAGTAAATGLATHMQPSFARRLLPCWDEPQLKARFSLVVVLPFRGYQTISNMPIRRKSITVSQCSGESMQEVEFHTTPTMSTYLLTLVVGRFEYLESITSNNCRVRLYVYSSLGSDGSSEGSNSSVTGGALQPPRNYRRSAAQMGLDCAVGSLERLEQLLAIRYPLAKLDLIGLREFNGGGMENWGASIFHENYLLYEQNNTNSNEHHHQQQQQPQELQMQGGRSRARRLVVPLVVAHEVAHQWFGNLVTAASWSYLWLNEGFAQMLMFELADHLWPQHRYWRMFLEDCRQAVMQEEQLYSSSHPLEPPPDSNQDQLSLFDQITYNKGAQVVQMLRQMMGADKFFSGLHHYLHKHSYLAVTSHDLWLALEEASGLGEGRLESLMSGWLHNEGFPLLTVRVREEPHQWRLTISQERFALLKEFELLRPSPAAELSAEPLWSMHVSVAGERDLAPPSDLFNALLSRAAKSSSSFLVEERQSLVLLPKSATGPNWFKLNSNATGYFRLNYELEAEANTSVVGQPVDMLARMIEPIRSGQLNAADRFNIVDDLFALVRASRRRTADYLAYLAAAFSRETDTLVLRPILESLKRIRLALVSNSPEPRLQWLYDAFVHQYLANVSQAANETTTTTGAELADLIETCRVQFNDSQSWRRASALFERSFRSAPLWDDMDRERRAGVLTGALLGASQADEDLASNSSLLEHLTAPEPTAPQHQDTFLRLFRAYASSESGAERFALATALGAIDSSRKQSKLLNLTLEGSYFRPQDAMTVLESMGRSRSGRQLLLESLARNAKTIERRQMLAPVLRSLAPGLVEPKLSAGATATAGEPQEVLTELRQLYRQFSPELGGHLNAAIEQLLVNSLWFKRDHRHLLAYLDSLQPQLLAADLPIR